MEKNSKKGCLGISANGWITIVFISVLIVFIDKCFCGGNLLGSNPFEDIVYEENKATIHYYFDDFDSGTGKPLEYDFVNLLSKVWDFRSVLDDKKIQEFEIIYTAKCSDRFGNETIREAGSYVFDTDGIQEIFKYQNEDAFKWSELRLYMALGFTGNCTGKEYNH